VINIEEIAVVYIGDEEAQLIILKGEGFKKLRDAT
jgi:hypothetical protein